MNVNTYIDIKLTEEDVKKIIAEFINKKYGGAINVDQYNIEIHVGMRERNFTEEPCFEDAVVHYRFGAEARIKE